jgi:hypothetical protein
MPDESNHLTLLQLSQSERIDVAAAEARLRARPQEWLGSPVESPDGVRRRYLTDLQLPLRAHSPALVFRKAAFVDLGEVRANETGLHLEIGWQSASLAPLFPVFAGSLQITDSGLTLKGFYAPPGGDIGVALDRAFFGIAARGTARWFLRQAALALESSPKPRAQTIGEYSAQNLDSVMDSQT